MFLKTHYLLSRMGSVYQRQKEGGQAEATVCVTAWALTPEIHWTLTQLTVYVGYCLPRA